MTWEQRMSDRAQIRIQAERDAERARMDAEYEADAEAERIGCEAQRQAGPPQGCHDCYHWVHAGYLFGYYWAHRQGEVCFHACHLGHGRFPAYYRRFAIG